jgi:thiosulfate/3-mercaptopyruvate sulfurtransferase
MRRMRSIEASRPKARYHCAMTTYSTLISVAQLQALQTAGAPLQVWDCSFDLMNPAAGPAAFALAHIAGAQYVHLDTDLSDKTAATDKASGGRHPLPSRAKFAAWLGAVGVTPATQVVVVDRNGVNYAGRAWWMLQWCGHAAVAVLDGGLQAWQAAGGAVQAGAAPIQADFSKPNYPVAQSIQAQAAIDIVASAVRHGSHTLIDARAAPRFRGEVEPLDAVAGHIPGALNRPFGLNLGEDGRFKPAAQLRTEFDALLAGRDPATVIHQCGSGVSAVPNLLAMAIAGYPPTALFAGSWSEWSSRADLPVARG